MINYLRHNQIDKQRWDDCIGNSLNRKVYAFSWYLDLVSPGWEALISDGYASVFPLTRHRKMTVSYLAQPYFSQQLGIFSPNEISEIEVNDFIRRIPRRFRFVEIHLNSMNRCSGVEGETILRNNYEIDLAGDYDELARNFAQNTRRNLKKAGEAELSLSRKTGVDELIGLFRENYGKKEGKLKERHYAILRQLMVYCLDNELGYILGSKTWDGALSAGAFFLFDRPRVYFLFAASSPAARENGAMFFLIDQFISGNSGRDLILDFEGGNDPNLGRFYKSFGAVEVPYPALRINHLSKVVENGLFLIRKLRK